MSLLPDEDYEYRGRLASCWDLLRGETSGWPDRAYYRDLIVQDGRPALDVGCGTGRLLLDYLEQGLDVDGVDVSPEMLDLCRDKARERGLAPALHLQAMEELDLPRRYGTIFVPSSSFQLITDAAAARRAMDRMVAHLLPGGRLAQSFMVLWRDGDPVERTWHEASDTRLPGSDRRIRRSSCASFDRVEQLQHTEDRFELMDGEEVLETEHHRRSPATRWYSLIEAQELYRSAGLEDVRATKGFTDRVARPEDTLFAMVGTRRVPDLGPDKS